MLARSALALVAGVLFAATIHAQSTDPRTDLLGDPLPPGAIARLGTLRFKHAPAANSTIQQAVYSPDGSKIATLAFGTGNVFGAGSVRVWEAASGKEILGPWTSLDIQHTTIAFSPDGMYLAAGVFERFFPNDAANQKKVPPTIVLYNLTRSGKMKTLFGQRLVRAIAFADRGKTLVSAGEGTVHWWDLASGNELRSWKPFVGDSSKNGGKQKTFTHCAISPDGTSIAVQVTVIPPTDINKGRLIQRNTVPQVDKEAVGFDLAKGEMRWRSLGKGPQFGTCHFAFSADGKCVAIALGGGKIELRATATGKLFAHPLDSKYAHANELGGLALSSNGGILALAGKDGTVQIGPARTDDAPRSFMARAAQSAASATACLRFSPDDKNVLVIVNADLECYNIATLGEVHPWEGHRDWVNHLAFSPDGKKLMTGIAGRSVPTAFAIGPNGQTFYAVGFGPKEEVPSPEVAAWDVATWKRLQLTSAHSPRWPNFGSAPLNQSVYLGKAGEDRFALFDMNNGKLVSRMRAPGNPFTPGAGVFSPSGKVYLQYATDNRGGLREYLYAVPSGKLIGVLPDSAVDRAQYYSQEPEEPSKGIAFSPDEQLVAQFGRGDGLIHVFDVGPGKLRLSLGKKLEPDSQRRFARQNHEAAFSNDNKYLSSWSTLDQMIHIWDMATGLDVAQFPADAPGAIAGATNRLQRRVNMAWSPDGRLLAVGDSKIHLWETATLHVRHELPGHQDGPIRVLAFSPNGQLLASGSADTTVLIWDAALLHDRRSDNAVTGTLEKRWQSLTEDAAGPAFAAIRDLAAAPEKSVAFIRERIQPASPVDPKRIVKLIGDLDATQFKVRQLATTELLQVGDRALPAIDKAIAAKPALETHLRLQDVRKRLASPVLKKDVLRAYRAIEVLERIATPDAREVLQTLAAGDTGALITTQARLALARLDKNVIAASK